MAGSLHRVALGESISDASGGDVSAGWLLAAAVFSACLGGGSAVLASSSRPWCWAQAGQAEQGGAEITEQPARPGGELLVMGKRPRVLSGEQEPQSSLQRGWCQKKKIIKEGQG